MADKAYVGWAIVELMGHRRLGGHISPVVQYGAEMARIDVACDPPVTQFYGGAAIFSVTPTSEELARAVGRGSVPQPVHPWEMAPRLPPSERVPDDDDELTEGDVG